MVNLKQITDLADTVTSYVNTCGKRSISSTRPQSLKGINASDLKLIPQSQRDIFTGNPFVKEFFTKITKAKDFESLTILANEIDNAQCSPQLKKILMSKFAEQYEHFYVDKFSKKQISPQNIFKNIFGRNLSEAETTKLCETYKSILNEPNQEKFIAKLYMQVKKDYGLEYLKPNIQLSIQKGSGLSVRGGMNPQNQRLKLTYFQDNPMNRFKIFSLMMHEFKHAKQTEMAIACDVEKYVETYTRRLAKQNPEMTLEQCKAHIMKTLDSDMLENIKRIYGDVDKNSSLYKQGMGYIESQEKYFSPKEFTAKGFLEYKQQLIEKEAYNVQDQASELYYYLRGKIYH